MVGYVMATYGGATTLSALVTSNLAASTGRQILICFAGVCTMAAFVTLYIWEPNEDNVIYAYVIVTVWGIAEGIWQTQSNGKQVPH